MRDRMTPSNGKRDAFWGTLSVCGECGRCLCYGCHPDGPCRDEREAPATAAIAATNRESLLSDTVGGVAARRSHRYVI